MIIPARFNGPPGSGNGGYSAGVFASQLGGAGRLGSDGTLGGAGRLGGEGISEVTLRRPPPLDVELSIVDSSVVGPDGAVVAEVGPAEPVDAAVPPVGYADAVQASRGYEGFADHPFPTCYGCGPARDDGLRIFAGRLSDGTTAAPWTVPNDVSIPVIWTSLDCSGGWTVVGAGRPYVMGRIAVDVARVPSPGEQCVVRGALASMEGRRATVHTTLYGPDGAELARARATWVAIA
jgi:hypothetical protein